MNAENILDSIGMVNEKAVWDARNHKRFRYGRISKWAAMAACVILIFTAAVSVLPGTREEPGGVLPSSTPDPAPTSSDVEAPADPDPQDIIIHWDNVAVNESDSLFSEETRRYNFNIYNKEIWGRKEIRDYYGWEFDVPYVPAGLTDGGQSLSGTVYRDKATGELTIDNVSRGFWSGYYADGSPKSSDSLYIPTGFTVAVSKLGTFFHCGVLYAEDAKVTSFGNVDVTLSHRSMPHGPFDPNQKDPSGLYNKPAGYYDIYRAAFTANGIQYEVEAQRLPLEEVVKIVASIINMPYQENFTVGETHSLPDKSREATDIPVAPIVPDRELDEPEEPSVP